MSSMSSTEEAPRATAPAAPAEPEPVRWVKCPRCAAFVYKKRLNRNLQVCPECTHHFRLSLNDRMRFLVDPDSYEELSSDVEPRDPLEFVDSKPYKVRIEAAQKKTGNKEGAAYGAATIGGTPLIVAVMDFHFIGGAMGTAVGEIITRAAETATHRRLPLLVACASGGARMQEGCLSLMQMAKTSAALAVHAEEKLPYVVLLTDPTYGGTTASFATLGDVLIAEPEALIGFAGRSVVESTIHQKLPDDFQRADFLMNHGMVDMVVPRGELRGTLGRLLGTYMSGAGGHAPSPDGLPDAEEVSEPVAEGDPRDPWETVQLARNQDRPNTLEYIKGVFSDFQQLHGDRLYGDDGALVAGVARLGSVSCMVMGTLKGRSIQENKDRNFSMPHPEGYRKALRLMRQAAKFNMPIILFVDTPGAYPGIGAEERGQSGAIAQNLLEMARFPVPIVAILTGEGGSGGALALGVADRVLILENAYYSVISPEGCSVILFKDVKLAPKAARALRITPRDLKQLEIVDRIIPEPEGGAHADPTAAVETMRRVLIREVRDLLCREPEQLVARRYQRYRRFGGPAEEY